MIYAVLRLTWKERRIEDQDNFGNGSRNAVSMRATFFRMRKQV